uniref:BED-type domain-containing protein n=1 Tax=Globodera rostochiensis TaxID=31243 RepID=A0A914GPN2_GLORO
MSAKTHDFSSWWHYFTRIGSVKSTTAQCKHCDKIIDQGPSKSTAKFDHHLKTKHAEQHKKRAYFLKEKKGKLDLLAQRKPNLAVIFSKAPPEPQLQAPIIPEEPFFSQSQTTADPSAQWSKDGAKTKEADKIVVEWLATDGIAFYQVEKKGFKRMVQFFAPNYQIKRRGYHSEIMPLFYKQLLDRIIADLKKVKFISITSDIWSSKANTHNLLALTAHFLTDEAQPAFVILGSMPVKEKHKTTQVVANYITARLDLLNSKIKSPFGIVRSCIQYDRCFQTNRH